LKKTGIARLEIADAEKIQEKIAPGNRRSEEEGRSQGKKVTEKEEDRGGLH
jgi:hypothetical protein